MKEPVFKKRIKTTKKKSHDKIHAGKYTHGIMNDDDNGNNDAEKDIN